MKVDLYNSQEKLDKWMSQVQASGVPNLSKVNSDLLIQFISDLKLGMNVSSKSKKGERSPNRLVHLKDKVLFVLRHLEARNIKDITKAKDEDLHKLFSDMRSGKIESRKGGAFKATGDYVKDTKVFWHWYMKVQGKKGKTLIDITAELDRRGEKPKFVYFTKEEFEKIINEVHNDLKPLAAVAYDTGARVTELLSLRVSDFSKDFKECNIRQETSKTFGRKIKIFLCADYIKKYIHAKKLEPNDLIFNFSLSWINKELQRASKKVLSKEQIREKNLSLYDFRHSSACYWLPIYKSESALKYRFGWKRSDMIYYYTELLGMTDTLTQDDLYSEMTKTELEKKVSDLTEKLEDALNLILKSGAVEKGQAYKDLVALSNEIGK